MSRETTSNERLRKDAARVIENPFWIGGIEPDKFYTRIHDDHDGSFTGSLSVSIDRQGDAWVAFELPNDGLKRPLRFRTWGGGGLSLRTRNALMILAEAIRRDNKERPHEKPR